MANLTFKKISIRNFLSFGNIPEELDLTSSNYRVIIGKNKDKSDSGDDANGSGKTSVISSLFYSIYGCVPGNKINLPSLVNNVNKKNMIVKLDFSIDDVDYTIERGRNPVILKFYKNGEEVVDESLGDSRDTQKEIEKVIGISKDVFSQIVCLTCNVPVFMEQPIGTQKEIIEKILGVDIISKKVVALKSLIQETKNNVNNKQFEYDTLLNQKKTLENSIQQQLSNLKQNQNNYEINKRNKIIELSNKIKNIEQIDFEKEENNLKQLLNYETILKENETKKLQLTKIENNIKDIKNQIQNKIAKLDELQKIDFNSERESFKYNETIKEEKIKYDSEIAIHKVNKDKLLKANNLFKDLSNRISKKENELNSIKDGICPLCGNIVDKEHTEQHRNKINEEIKDLREQYHQCDLEILDLTHLIGTFKEKSFEFKPTHFNSYEELLNSENEISTLINDIKKLDSDISDLDKQSSEIVLEDLCEKPICKFNSIEELLTQKVTLENLLKQLEEINKEENPYNGQEESILKMREQIIEPNDTELNAVKDDLEHQEVLLKLLSSPTSFIRKNILDKSLEFLNAKIKHYLIKMGSLHSVELNNDMSINISSMGLDYNYVSTGEMSRISFALNFAFRDVWEALNNTRINLYMFDEVLDKSGLDTSGKRDIVECLSSINDRNLLVVSHDEIIKSSTMDILTIVKEQGFSHIE